MAFSAPLFSLPLWLQVPLGPQYVIPPSRRTAPALIVSAWTQTGNRKEFDGYLDATNWAFKLPLQRLSWENRVSSLAVVWETSISKTKSFYSLGTREEAAQALCVDHLYTWLILILILLDHSHHEVWMKNRAVCRSSWSLSYIIRGYLRVSQWKQFSRTWTRWMSWGSTDRRLLLTLPLWMIHLRFLIWVEVRPPLKFFSLSKHDIDVWNASLPTVANLCRPPRCSAGHNSRIFDMVFASCIRLALQAWMFLACSEIINESTFLLSNPYQCWINIGACGKKCLLRLPT